MDAEFRPYIWQGSVGVLNQRVCKIIPIRDSVCRLFVYEVMKPHLEYIEHYKTGTTVSHIGKADIDKIRIIIPPDDVLQSFFNIAEPLFLQLLNNAKQSRALAAIRDALLPKLMSGEIEVPVEV